MEPNQLEPSSPLTDVKRRRQKLQVAIGRAEEAISNSLKDAAIDGSQFGLLDEALKVVLQTIRGSMESAFQELRKEAPDVQLSDGWEKEKLQVRLAEMREEVRIHRRRIARQKHQFRDLAERYRRQRAYIVTFRENYWRGLSELVTEMSSKGLNVGVVNRFANDLVNPDEEEDPSELGSTTFSPRGGAGSPKNKKKKDWFLEFDDDLEGLTTLDEEEVATQIAEAVHAAQVEERKKIALLEEALKQLELQRQEDIAEAVRNALGDLRNEKQLYELIKKEYEHRIDELQSQIDASRLLVEQRVAKARQLKEQSVTGLSKDLEAAQLDGLQLRKIAIQLEQELAGARENEEQLKLDLLNATTTHKKEMFQQRKAVQLLRAKLDSLETPDSITKRVAKPLLEKIATLEERVSDLEAQKEKLLQSLESTAVALSDAQRQTQSRTEAWNESQGELKLAQAKYRQLEREHQDISAQLAARKDDHSRMMERLDWQNELVMKLNETVDQQKKRIAELEGLLTAARASIQAAGEGESQRPNPKVTLITTPRLHSDGIGAAPTSSRRGSTTASRPALGLQTRAIAGGAATGSRRGSSQAPLSAQQSTEWSTGHPLSRMDSMGSGAFRSSPPNEREAAKSGVFEPPEGTHEEVAMVPPSKASLSDSATQTVEVSKPETTPPAAIRKPHQRSVGVNVHLLVDTSPSRVPSADEATSNNTKRKPAPKGSRLSKPTPSKSRSPGSKRGANEDGVKNSGPEQRPLRSLSPPSDSKPQTPVVPGEGTSSRDPSPERTDTSHAREHHRQGTSPTLANESPAPNMTTRVTHNPLSASDESLLADIIDIEEDEGDLSLEQLTKQPSRSSSVSVARTHSHPMSNLATPGSVHLKTSTSPPLSIAPVVSHPDPPIPLLIAADAPVELQPEPKRLAPTDSAATTNGASNSEPQAQVKPSPTPSVQSVGVQWTTPSLCSVISSVELNEHPPSDRPGDHVKHKKTGESANDLTLPPSVYFVPPAGGAGISSKTSPRLALDGKRVDTGNGVAEKAPATSTSDATRPSKTSSKLHPQRPASAIQVHNRLQVAGALTLPPSASAPPAVLVLHRATQTMSETESLTSEPHLVSAAGTLFKAADGPGLPSTDLVTLKTLMCSKCHGELLKPAPTAPTIPMLRNTIDTVPHQVPVEGGQATGRPQSGRVARAVPRPGSSQPVALVGGPNPPSIPTPKRLAVRQLSLVPASYFAATPPSG